jgi:predicted dehydrogenase
VRAAHLPAYRMAGFDVQGIYDIAPDTARKTAAKWKIPVVYPTLDAACAADGVVFDVAVPASEVLDIVAKLPSGAPVLIQKPLGRDLRECRKIVTSCRKKKLRAAVNFQLRFAPNMIALRGAVAGGLLGEVTDVEIRVNTWTPWALWSFLKGIPRLEILYHSIHYIDLIRSLFGEPSGVHASALGHPQSRGYADVRSSIILLFDKGPRCALYTNHQHPEGSPHAASFIKVEGTRGAAVAQMGVNLQYPTGRPDRLEICTGGHWHSTKLPGRWFPHAFIGTMNNLQRHCARQDKILYTSVADAARTMAVVEACYRSSARPATPVPKAGD